MKIYSISNMICFIIQVGVLMAIQFGAGEQVIKIWHWESIQHEVDFSNTSSSNSQNEIFLSTEYDTLSTS